MCWCLIGVCTGVVFVCTGVVLVCFGVELVCACIVWVCACAYSAHFVWPYTVKTGRLGGGGGVGKDLKEEEIGEP